MEKYSSQFCIDACELCGLIIEDNIFNKGKNKKKYLIQFKKSYNMKENINKIFNIAKEIFYNELDNDKYGINNLKEVKYE